MIASKSLHNEPFGSNFFRGVSVVIPAYNAEKYLARTIESVLAQKFDGPFQIIVIDDGSKDRTFEIATNYKDRVCAIRKENGGVSSARNVGLRVAKHQFIALLDADDIMCEDRLTIQYNALSKSPESVLCCTSDELIGKDDEILDKKNSTLDTSKIQGATLLQKLFHRNFINTSSVMLRKTPALQAGGFNEQISHSEDLDLWLRLSRLGSFLTLSDRLVKYRQHENQSINNSIAMAKGRFEVRVNFLQSFPEVKHWLGKKLAEKKISSYAEAYGYDLVVNGQGGKARKAYLKAIQLAPLNLRLWKFFIKSFFYPIKQYVVSIFYKS